jgi:DNA-binding XRE family transcriptional regulator
MVNTRPDPMSLRKADAPTALGPPERGGRIRAERLRLGLTQGQVAGLLGVHRKSYAQIEGYANPTTNRLMDPRALVPELFAANPAPGPVRFETGRDRRGSSALPGGR